MTVSGIPAEQSAWADPDSQRFYREHRQSTSDLYPSERLFLPWVLPRVTSCLDIGCAAGGFCAIMRSFNPTLEYTGLDIIPAFVETAKAAHPEGRFVVGDGIVFETPDDSYDLVYSSGILHVNSRWKDILTSGYAQAKRYLLADFRLTTRSGCEGTFRVDFDQTGKGAGRALPYVILNTSELVSTLRELSPPPRAITLRGYPFPPSATADVPVDEVLMVFALVEKGAPGDLPQVTIDITPDNRTKW